MSPTDKPTAKQLAHLRQLAARLGQSFAYPQTRAQASAEIRRLRSAQRGRDAGIDRQAERRERRAIQRDLQRARRRRHARGPRARGHRLRRQRHLALNQQPTGEPR